MKSKIQDELFKEKQLNYDLTNSLSSKDKEIERIRLMINENEDKACQLNNELNLFNRNVKELVSANIFNYFNKEFISNILKSINEISISKNQKSSDNTINTNSNNNSNKITYKDHTHCSNIINISSFKSLFHILDSLINEISSIKRENIKLESLNTQFKNQLIKQNNLDFINNCEYLCSSNLNKDELMSKIQIADEANSPESITIRALESKLISIVKEKSFLEKIIQLLVTIANSDDLVQIIQEMITTNNLKNEYEKNKKNLLSRLTAYESINALSEKSIISNITNVSDINTEKFNDNLINNNEILEIQKNISECNKEIDELKTIILELEKKLMSIEFISEHQLINLQECEEKLLELHEELIKTRNNMINTNLKQTQNNNNNRNSMNKIEIENNYNSKSKDTGQNSKSNNKGLVHNLIRNNNKNTDNTNNNNNDCVPYDFNNFEDLNTEEKERLIVQYYTKNLHTNLNDTNDENVLSYNSNNKEHVNHINNNINYNKHKHSLNLNKYQRRCHSSDNFELRNQIKNKHIPQLKLNIVNDNHSEHETTLNNCNKIKKYIDSPNHHRNIINSNYNINYSNENEKDRNYLVESNFHNAHNTNTELLDNFSDYDYDVFQLEKQNNNNDESIINNMNSNRDIDNDNDVNNLPPTFRNKY